MEISKLEIYHFKNHSLKGQVFVKCKSDYGRLSRKLNQVDIHMGIIFYRPEHMVFLKGCMQKKNKNKKKTYLVLKT